MQQTCKHINVYDHTSACIGNQIQDSKPLLPEGAVVPPGIANQISEGDGQDDALLLLQQQEIKAKLREENARKALLRGGLGRGGNDIIMCSRLLVRLIIISFVSGEAKAKAAGKKGNKRKADLEPEDPSKKHQGTGADEGHAMTNNGEKPNEAPTEEARPAAKPL